MNPRIHALGSLAASVALVGCDAALSRFDRVDVDIDGRQAAEVQEAGGAGAGAGTDTGTGAGADGSGASTTPGTDVGTGTATGETTAGTTSGDTTAGTTSGDTGSGSGMGTGSGATPDTTNPTVNAGSDQVRNAAFTSAATASDDSGAVTVRWSQTSGPGTANFVSATTAGTSISATMSGVYVLRLTATDAAGNSAFDEMTLNWDVDPPSLPTLTTAADSASGPDTRSDDDTTVFLVWTASSDGAGSGFKDYTVQWFTNATCAGMAAGSSTLTGTSQSVTGSLNNSVSFKVTVSDQLGNSATTGCSPAILSEQVPPPSLSAALAAAAGTTVGAVTVTIDLPDVTTDVDRVVLRRKIHATTAPTCGEAEAVDVTTVKTWQGALPNPAAVVFTDETGLAGRQLMYRACIYDAAGNVTSSNATETFGPVTTKNQILFTTETAYTGNLGGLAGADGLCATHEGLGTAIVSQESIWRAVLSDEFTDAKWRVQILGKVVDATNVDILDGRANAWSGVLLGPVYGDEDGDPASAVTWTGSDVAGARVANGHCNNWSYGSGTTHQGQLGDPTVGNADWISFGAPVDCLATTQRTVYCISQAPVTALGFDAATATGPGAAGRVTVSVTPPADDVARARYWQIKVQRVAGGTAPDSNCTAGDAMPVNLTAPFTAAALTATDTPGAGSYSYRVCGYDVHGNLIYTATDVNVPASM